MANDYKLILDIFMDVICIEPYGIAQNRQEKVNLAFATGSAPILQMLAAFGVLCEGYRRPG